MLTKKHNFIINLIITKVAFYAIFVLEIFRFISLNSIFSLNEKNVLQKLKYIYKNNKPNDDLIFPARYRTQYTG